MSDTTLPVLIPNLQVGFHYRLKSIRDLYFHDALRRTVRELNVREIDQELAAFVSSQSLKKLALFSIRGEALFPVPLLLRTNPFLLGYYRLLLGFSQKEFYSKGPFGTFRSMEDRGRMSLRAEKRVKELCKSLVQSCEYFIHQLDELSLPLFADLQLLTVGPQLRGSINNEFGVVATQKVFALIKEALTSHITTSTPTSIEIQNASGRAVKIKFSSDPDIEILEALPSGERGLVSVEIKGGRDFSNIHNRIGEAEKSHQKARKRGYFEFITILSVDINYEILKSESPTTSHFFHLDKISDKDHPEYNKFRDLLSSILGVAIS